jgi:hypothetical protein
VNVTPLTIAGSVAVKRPRTANAASARYLAARRRDSARNGYRGPLTRAELAAQASRTA